MKTKSVGGMLETLRSMAAQLNKRLEKESEAMAEEIVELLKKNDPEEISALINLLNSAFPRVTGPNSKPTYAQFAEMMMRRANHALIRLYERGFGDG
jgi:hypothetical protein